MGVWEEHLVNNNPTDLFASSCCSNTNKIFAPKNEKFKIFQLKIKSVASHPDETPLFAPFWLIRCWWWASLSWRLGWLQVFLSVVRWRNISDSSWGQQQGCYQTAIMPPLLPCQAWPSLTGVGRTLNINLIGPDRARASIRQASDRNVTISPELLYIQDQRQKQRF